MHDGLIAILDNHWQDEVECRKRLIELAFSSGTAHELPEAYRALSLRQLNAKPGLVAEVNAAKLEKAKRAKSTESASSGVEVDKPKKRRLDL